LRRRRGLSLAPFARIPEREYGVIGRLLDGGVLGIIAPRVNPPKKRKISLPRAAFRPSAIDPPLPHWLTWNSKDAGGAIQPRVE